MLDFMLIWAALVLLQPRAESLDKLPLLRVVSLRGETHHVQGIDIESGRVWVTSVDDKSRKGFLHEFSLEDGAFKRVVEIQDGERFHPGGLQAEGESLWIPVAEYRRNSTAAIQRRSKRTLDLEFQFTVPDHIGCIAVTPEFLIGGNWDSRDFHVWDHQGKLIRKISNRTPNAYQDMKFHDGHIVASGLLPGRKGAIDWLALPSLDLIRRLEAGATDRGVPFTQEGMAIAPGQLLLLPEDSPSRLFIFRLDR